jgi:calcineurin-like phosphoesterase family protein
MTTFFFSDPHFGQPQPKRPFADYKAMDAALLQNWNETVGTTDEVWVLGDLGNGFKSKLGSLSGRKHLIPGNIDDIAEVMRAGIFEKVKVAEWLKPDKLLLTHIPVHPDELRWGKHRNVHGHTHERSIDDPRYLCVSVDQTDYRPISLEEVLARLAAQAGAAV